MSEDTAEMATNATEYKASAAIWQSAAIWPIPPIQRESDGYSAQKGAR
jgi:hypothetical protein